MSVEDCTELQEQEWQALQSIYPEFIPHERPKDGAPFVLQIDVQLSKPVPVQLLHEDSPEPTHTISVSHLPQLFIDLLLPPTYPLKDPPVIRSLHSMHNWLPPPLTEFLQHRLLDMWDNERVLDHWVEQIRSGEDLLSLLNLFRSSPTSVRLPNPSPHILFPALVAYDASVLESRFRRATHTCPICLSRFAGTLCIALSPCAHVVCRACLSNFWGSCILEGAIERVGCPDPECVKQSIQASAEDVNAVLSPEQVERWQWLLHKRETERDPTIVHCPLVFCQKPIKRPPPAEDGRSEWDRLRTCECGFAFCMYCRRAWHGPHTSCSLLTTAEFATSYLQHAEGSPERQAIERQYGKSNVLKVIAKFQEEQSNRRWVERETMTCPGCHIRVQKHMGCNHMTCVKCQQHFCYCCGAKLDASSPYRHFNIPGQPCYYKLFDSQNNNEDV